MSDSEYEDFGSGDESFDDELDEVYESKADIFEDDDDFENLKCKILSSLVSSSEKGTFQATESLIWLRGI